MLIGNQSGGFGALVLGDFFGGSLAPMGDVDGDGVGDLAVGGNSISQSFWTLLLRPDGSVRVQNRIGPFGPSFGRRLAALGDLDGDGIDELATTTTTGISILFLRADGTLRSQRVTFFSDPLFMPATQASHLDGGALCGIGDLDGDGIGDLAVGAPRDPDGGPSVFQKGAVWILRLNADGTVKAIQKISERHGGFVGLLGNNDLFGHALVRLGDLDADGHTEIGVGSAGGDSFQRFWVIELASSGTSAAELQSELRFQDVSVLHRLGFPVRFQEQTC